MRRGAAHRLRALTEPARRRLSGTARRSSKDYATHIPILIALAQHFPIEHVLELGCGTYSTRLFLDATVFANLNRLESFDNDESWIEKISKEVGNDSRYRSHLVRGSMASIFLETSLKTFDLVFVDDSTTAEERTQTIRQLTAQKPTDILVVIHDFEINDYRSAAAGFEHSYTFKAFTPQTGVVWNGQADRVGVIKNLQSEVKRWAKGTEPDDLKGWLKVLSR